MAATEYSLSQAFKRIEEELIKSMIRNFEKHKAEELEEGFNWDQWQVVQLRELEKYRQNNKEKFDEEFTDLNNQIEELLRMTNQDAQTKEEAKILDQIKKGVFFDESEPGIDAGVFAINDKKLDTLIESTTHDLEKAEHAVLRRSNDIYRRVIYDAQVYAAEGGTYEQAVDMATKDFAKNGIQSIVYKNGSRHNIGDYASMAIRTANKRAYLLGEGKKHAQYGIHTVRVAKREGACPLCIRWVGKVLIDDVYGGGTKQEAREKRLPLLSTAMAKGFLHPNCKDIYSLYIEGVSKPADPWSEYELKVLADKYNQEEGIKHAEIMAGKWQLVADTRLDKENRAQAEARFREWQEKAKQLREGRSAGGGVPQGETDTRMVKEIDFNDKDAIRKLLDDAQKAFADLDHEEDITITPDGKVWYSVAEGGFVSTAKITSDRAGSYSYHNHPKHLTFGSFGEDDIESFLFYREEYAQASDYMYTYIMRRTDKTKSVEKHEAFNKHKELASHGEALQRVVNSGRDPDMDVFHEAMEILSEEYGFIYERKRNK